MASSSELLSGKSPSFFQAENMGERTGIKITPGQIDLYIGLREKPVDETELLVSDQVLMARVLERTGGPVRDFELFYSNIKFPKLS